MGPTIQIKNRVVSLPICNNMQLLPDRAVWIITARGRTLAWACPPDSDIRHEIWCFFWMQAAAYGFGEWMWEAMRSDQPESFRSVCTLCACGHISQCMKPGSMKSLWHFLTLFKFSLTIFSQTKFVILSELPALLLYVQSSSFTLQFALWHSAFITVTLIWRRWRRWRAKCNLDLERVDVEMNLFNRCHSNFGCFKAWQKARKTVEFFQVLLQIQLLRDTQKFHVTLVTFLHTFTHRKGSSPVTFQAWPHCMVCFPGSALVFHRTVDPKKMS